MKNKKTDATTIKDLQDIKKKRDNQNKGILTGSDLVGLRVAPAGQNNHIIVKDGTVVTSRVAAREDSISEEKLNEQYKNEQATRQQDINLFTAARETNIKYKAVKARYIGHTINLENRQQRFKEQQFQYKQQIAEEQQAKQDEAVNSQLANQLKRDSEIKNKKKSKGIIGGIKDSLSSAAGSLKGLKTPTTEKIQKLTGGGLPTVIMLFVVLLFLLFLLKPVDTAVSGVKQTKASLLGLAMTGNLTIVSGS